MTEMTVVPPAATLTTAQLKVAQDMCGYLTTPAANLHLTPIPVNSAIAACGNAAQESGFDPTVLGDGGVSYGLFQWQGSRLVNLRNWCQVNGLDSASVLGQCMFFLYELPTGDGMGADAAWITDTSNNGQPTRSLETLTADICQYYERPSVPDLDNRINYAHQVQAYLNLGPPPGPTPTLPVFTMTITGTEAATLVVNGVSVPIQIGHPIPITVDTTKYTAYPDAAGSS